MKNLVIIAVIGVLIVLGCAGPRYEPAPSPATPTPTPAPTPTPNPNKEKDYQEGFKVGFKEGKEWRKIPGQNLPEPYGFSVIIEDVARENGKTDNFDWRKGWIDGCKKGFGLGLGGNVKSAEDDADFERVSWDTAEINVMLFDNSEKHIATITAVDQDSGVVTLRYVSGTVEQKLFASVAPYFFVKKHRK